MKTYTTDEQLEQLRKRRKWYDLEAWPMYVTNALTIFLLPPVWLLLAYLAGTHIHPLIAVLIMILGIGGTVALFVVPLLPDLGRWIKRMGR